MGRVQPSKVLKNRTNSFICDFLAPEEQLETEKNKNKSRRCDSTDTTVKLWDTIYRNNCQSVARNPESTQHTSTLSITDHPFYQNSINKRRASGLNPFINVERFDRSPNKQIQTSVKKKSPNKLYQLNPDLTDHPIKYLQNSRKKSPKRRKKSQSPNRRDTTVKSTVIKPYKKRKQSSNNYDISWLKEYETEKVSAYAHGLTKYFCYGK